MQSDEQLDVYITHENTLAIKERGQLGAWVESDKVLHLDECQ